MCRLLVEEIFPRYATALQIISDQGLEFDNQLVKGVCQIMGTSITARHRYNSAKVKYISDVGGVYKK